LRAEFESKAFSRGLQFPSQALRVGTDCSGLDAPVFALKALALPGGIRHMFSCEVCVRKQAFLRENNTTVVFYPDMLKRNHSLLADIDVYLYGFHCKPFSTLHTGSQGFREQAARPFVAVLATLRQKLPPLAVLENVWGIRRHLNRVHRALHSLKWYEVITVGIDPYEMGEPVRRRRCWFVLVRVDVARARAGDLDDHARALLPLGRRTEHAQPSERLLTNDCTYIQEFLRRRARPKQITAASRGGLRPAASRGVRQLWRSQCAPHPRTKLSQIVQGL